MSRQSLLFHTLPSNLVVSSCIPSILSFQEYPFKSIRLHLPQLLSSHFASCVFIPETGRRLMETRKVTPHVFWLTETENGTATSYQKEIIINLNLKVFLCRVLRTRKLFPGIQRKPKTGTLDSLL